MAYQEYGMWEILDVLRRYHRNESQRSISRVTGHGRQTIKRYIDVACRQGWHQEQEPTEELACRVVAQLQPGPREETENDVKALLARHMEQLREWFEPSGPYGRSLTVRKAHKKLCRMGVQVSYMALWRFVKEHFPSRKHKGTVRRAESLPGDMAEVDFGRMGLVFDQQQQRKRRAHALVVTLGYSRHQYVHITFDQQFSSLIEGLEDAWEFFGGVPKRVVFDNMKTAIIKADRYDPIFHRTFSLYADHRGFVIDAAEARKPTHKPIVERQIQYVRENFFRGETFVGLADIQERATKWCLQEAGLRIHGTTRQQPLVVFETTEKETLQALTKERFDTPQWAQVKVHQDCHVRFGNALYSVPHQYRKKRATICANSKLVRIYVNGQHVKTHPKTSPGKRSTDKSDYPVGTAAYAMRDIQYYIIKGYGCGEFTGIFMEQLLSGTYPWSRLRQAQRLLRHIESYGAARVEDACRRAVAFEIIDVSKVIRILTQAIVSTNEPEQTQAVIHLPLTFLRNNTSFTHTNKEDTSYGHQSNTQE